MQRKGETIFFLEFPVIYTINVILFCVTHALTLGYLTVIVGPITSLFHITVNSFRTFVLKPWRKKRTLLSAESRQQNVKATKI